MAPHRRRLTESQKRIVGAQGGWRCGMCDETLASTYHVDHIVPLWAGGADTPEQCWPLCTGCHATKTQRESIERTERKRRLRAAGAAGAQGAHERRCPLECTGCGVVFSPYFAHTCQRPSGWAWIAPG